MSLLLLECSIRAALIAAVVAVVLRAFRVTNPAARHVAWCGVLAAMLALPALIEWAPKTSIHALPPVAEEAAVLDRWVPALDPIPAPSSEAISKRSDPPSQAMEPSRREPWTLPEVLLGAYFLGAGIMLMRLLLGTVRAAAILRRSEKQPGFLVSAECACPVTVGWRKPSVVLPLSWTAWPPGELDAVLAHEREHARRRDPLAQWLAAPNRSVFWFHPLAWWLERRLAALAEETCDDVVIARGHDPGEYSDYLVHLARGIRGAGTRMTFGGVAIGGGLLKQRIERILEARPARALSRAQAMTAAALCVTLVIVFTACHVDRVERPAAGQPTMNELMHRREDEFLRQQQQRDALEERARALTPPQAQVLLAKLKQNPEDEDTYWTLVHYYQHRENLKGLDELRLWYIEHQPGGKVWDLIDPKLDRVAYDRGKALWLDHLKASNVPADVYERAAHYLAAADKPLAESMLQAGQKAYPDDKRWAGQLGSLYARTLVGEERHGAYAEAVRARLAASTDARLLATTAMQLTRWSGRVHSTPTADNREDPLELARSLLSRAQSIDPKSEAVLKLEMRISHWERGRRYGQLYKLSPDEIAKLDDNDRMTLSLYRMRNAWRGFGGPGATDPPRQNLDGCESNARELLSLAARHPGDSRFSDPLFEAHIMLGKIAMMRGDRKSAVRSLLAAADTPGPGPSSELGRGEVEMNLPRALIDWGERRAVAEFCERVAPKTAHPERFLEWAAQIRKGINPDLIPTMGRQGCTNDPC